MTISHSRGMRGQHLRGCSRLLEKRSYPYRDAITILDEWFSTHPAETNLRDRLTISGLSQALKAEKREELARMLAEIVDVRVETELRIGREQSRTPRDRT